MLTESILVSSFAALALANPAANAEAARITQAPIRRQFGEAGDIIDGVISDGLDVVSSWILGDDASADACASAIGEIGDIPQPTGDLASALETSDAGVCEISEDLDDDLQGAWEDYSSAASKWYADNSDAVSSALDACPSEFDELVQSFDCITGDGDGESSGGDDSEDAAMRVTGVVIAAAGAAVAAIAVIL